MSAKAKAAVRTMWSPVPPPGWVAHVDPQQGGIVVLTHQTSGWRKYPKPGQLFTPADDKTFYCEECFWPKRWMVHMHSYENFCWFCEDQRAARRNDDYWQELHAESRQGVQVGSDADDAGGGADLQVGSDAGDAGGGADPGGASSVADALVADEAGGQPEVAADGRQQVAPFKAPPRPRVPAPKLHAKAPPALS